MSRLISLRRWLTTNRHIRRLWFFWKWNFFRKAVSRLQWRFASRNPIDLLDLGNPRPSKVPNAIHTDIYGGDIRWDLNAPIPLPNASVKRIYSAHTLEHLSYESILRVLSECARVLEPGGVIRLCLPDARLFIRAYCEDRSFLKPGNDFPLGWNDTGSKIDGLNYIAYLGDEHRFLFDPEVAINLLERANFEDVKVDSYDVRFDSPDRLGDSFYVVGVGST